MKRFLCRGVNCALFVTALASASCRSEAPTLIDGFVTSVISANRITVGDVSVSLSPQTTCQVEDLDYSFELQSEVRKGLMAWRSIVLRQHSPGSNTPLESCAQADIRVGTRVRVSGEYKPRTVFEAKSATVFAVHSWKLISEKDERDELNGGALIEVPPHVSRSSAGWVGTAWIDGYPLVIDSNTRLEKAAPDTQIVYDYGFVGFHGARLGTTSVGTAAKIPTDIGDLLRPNSFGFFKATKGSAGRLVANSLEMWPNALLPNEVKYRDRVRVRLTEPGYKSGVPGRIDSPHERGVQIVPSQAVQDWIARFGDRLIPSYDRSLPDSDPTKVKFRFCIVHGSGSDLKGLIFYLGGLFAVKHPSFDEAVLPLPDGRIIVFDETLSKLKTESQLASILSFAITMVLQRDAYMVNQSLRNWEASYDRSFPQFDFAILRDEQSLRIGIRQMLLAGYDIRDAPFAWAVAAAIPATNPASEDAGPSVDFPWYAAYAFDYISQFYSDVDYSKLKRGEREYAQFLDELRKADPEAFAKQK